MAKSYLLIQTLVVNNYTYGETKNEREVWALVIVYNKNKLVNIIVSC